MKLYYIRINQTEKSSARISKRCPVKCVNRNDILKFPKLAFSYKFIVAATLDQKSYIFLCQFIFYECIASKEMVEGVFEIPFACKMLKLVPGSKPG